MAKVAAAGAVSAPVRLKALELVRTLPQKDFAGEIVAIGRFVRDKIRYVRDVWQVETVQTPQATLELGQGDCDDKSTLVAALLMSIGNQVRFGLVNRRDHIVHVFTQVRYRGRWVTLETTENVPLGTLPRLPPGDRLEFVPIRPFEL